MDDLEEWERKLVEKIKWTKKERRQVFEEITHMKADESFLSVEGIIVTQRPFYDKLYKSCEVVFWHDLPVWLSKINWR